MKTVLKIIGIGLAAIFILAVIIAVIPGGDKKLEEVNKNLEQTNQELETKIEAQTEEEKIRKIVTDIFESNSPNDKIRQIDVLSQIDGGWGVFVEYEADNAGTRIDRKQRIDNLMANIYNALFSSSYDIQQATVNAYMLVPIGHKNEIISVYKTIFKKEFTERTTFNDTEPNSEERADKIKYLWSVSIYNEEYLSN